MKNKKISVFIVLMATSSGVLAVNNGVAVSRSDYQQFVNMNCSGTIVGGKWVLTAAHCNGGSVMIHDGTNVAVKSKYNHPSFDGTLSDMALWELQNSVNVNKINTFSITKVGAGQAIEMFGFGGTQPNLFKAVQTTDSQGAGVQSQWLRTLFTGSGDSTGGDSGSAYLMNGEIVGIHNGGNSVNADGMEGFRVENGKQFLLDTVNGWHFPTNLAFNGKQTIMVQSLHVGGTADAAFVSGDLNIDYASSTCDDITINEFSKCSYTVESNGGYGELHLSNSETIYVNKATNNNSGTANDGGSSGGSINQMVLFIFVLLGLSRWFIKHND